MKIRLLITSLALAGAALTGYTLTDQPAAAPQGDTTWGAPDHTDDTTWGTPPTDGNGGGSGTVKPLDTTWG
jgi:hypothetical protein